MELLHDPQAWLSLVTLSALEIVLGIDNLVFLGILTERLPEGRRPLAEKLGIGLALAARLVVLAVVAWAIRLTEPLISVLGQPLSVHDIVLLGGGVFLLAKGTHEIHGALEGDEAELAGAAAGTLPLGRLWVVATQIVLLDVVFALDSVAAAVGMAGDVPVMAAAIVVAMVLMLVAAAPLSLFLSRHPTVKMLALAFLLLLGTTLVADGLGVHVPKATLGFALVFSVVIEALNLLARRRRRPASDHPPAE